MPVSRLCELQTSCIMFEMCTVWGSPAVHVSRCCCSNHAAATWPRKTPGCDFVTEMLGPRAIVDGVAGSQKPFGSRVPPDLGGFWPWRWGYVDGPNQTSSKSTGQLLDGRLTGGLDFFSRRVLGSSI